MLCVAFILLTRRLILLDIYKNLTNELHEMDLFAPRSLRDKKKDLEGKSDGVMSFYAATCAPLTADWTNLRNRPLSDVLVQQEAVIYQALHPWPDGLCPFSCKRAALQVTVQERPLLPRGGNERQLLCLSSCRDEATRVVQHHATPFLACGRISEEESRRKIIQIVKRKAKLIFKVNNLLFFRTTKYKNFCFWNHLHWKSKQIVWFLN